MFVNRTTSLVSSVERLDAEHGADAELRMAHAACPSWSAMPVD